LQVKATTAVKDQARQVAVAVALAQSALRQAATMAALVELVRQTL
jgi:hypothetical protein